MNKTKNNNGIYAGITTRQKIGLILLGILFGLIILEVILNITSSILFNLQRLDFQKQGLYNNSKKQYRILALGESTTAELYNGENSWPSELEIILNNMSDETEFIVFNEGIPATQSSFILAKLESNIKKYNPDMVISMMGINDGGYIYFNDDNLFRKLKIYNLYKWVFESIKNKFYPLHEFMPDEYYCQNDLLSNETQAKIELIDKLRVSYELETAEELLLDLKKSVNESCIKNKILGDLYMKMGVMYQISDAKLEAEQYKKAEYYYEKLVEYKPLNFAYTFMLGHIYEKIGTLIDDNNLKLKAIEQYRLGFKLSKGYVINEWVYPEYKMLLDNTLNVSSNSLFYTIPYETLTYVSNSTADIILKMHYQKMFEILKKNNIKYAAMQYTRKPISMIKDYFKDNSYAEEIIFISNEDNFNLALMNYSYQDIFIDAFGGDFGHCTKLGNQLIAENVANTIFEELKTEGIVS